ncbi:Heterogeneous nuclear ribonucleoprotein Q [Linum perenne]
MTEGTEVDERVDFEEDNYMEDEDVEEQPDDGEDDRANNRNLHGEDDEDDDDSNPKEEEEEEHSPQDDVDEEIDVEAEPVEEDEEKPADSFNDEEREKRAQLLALPPHGSEVFIGGLPKDVVEDDLNELCEAFGEIFEIRLVKDKDTGESKGFAFVSFKSKEVAQKAIDELHNKQFRGKTLRCSLSETKNRLFVGNIPKNLTEDQFRTVIEEVGPGAEVIELIKVKALYVKNIPENTTTERLKELFIRHGEVTKVVMPPGKAGKRDFGFIHFAERSSALKAVKDTEKYEIDGQSLEVVLAKPQADKRSDGAYLYGAGMPPAHVATPSYGAFAANPYGSMGGGFGAASGFQQPMIYGRGPMPSGMQMVPMVLPDGRVGYVLQQPGMQLPHSRPPRRGDRGNGMSGSGRGGGSNSDDGNRGRRYRPY